MITVKYYPAEGMCHNWEVYQDGFLVGYAHCDNNGEDFGGSINTADAFNTSVWDRVQELCFSDLAALYLIDDMERMEY